MLGSPAPQRPGTFFHFKHRAVCRHGTPIVLLLLIDMVSILRVYEFSYSCCDWSKSGHVTCDNSSGELTTPTKITVATVDLFTVNLSFILPVFCERVVILGSLQDSILFSDLLFG